MVEGHSAHIAELVRVSTERVSQRDRIIHESWLRCVTEHKLDPAVLREAQIVTAGQLREHRDALDEFLRTARFGVETLYRQVAGLGYVLLLTDAKGVTVDFLGDPTFNNHCRKAGLYLGADWSESHAGTCAVGTCITTGEALSVHQTDHFDATHIPLTCTAAPIYDPSGAMAAVLDISALRSPEPKGSQFLALNLVKSFAHKIETANLLESFPSRMDLAARRQPGICRCRSRRRHGGQRFWRHYRNQQSREKPAATGTAHAQADRRTHAAAVPPGCLRMHGGRPAALCSFASGRTARAAPAPQRTHAVRADPAAAGKKAPSETPARRPLPPALAALSGDDDAMRDVLSRAAKLINTQMGLLIQGETGTGKEHLTKALHNISPRARENPLWR